MISKRILLVWDYQRYDLLEYLLEFADEMELVFIAEFMPGEVPDYMCRKNISVTYWSEYSSPYKLLNRVRPDKIVFADLESFNQIALNIAARNSGIPTFVLQHGFRTELEVTQAQENPIYTSLNFTNTSSWSMRFFLRSLRLKNLPHLFTLARFIYKRKRNELTNALSSVQFELRRADKYIEFSEENASYFQSRDGVPDNRFIFTGNPMIDSYFEYLNEYDAKHGSTSDYLLIDCPFVAADLIGETSMTMEKKNRYLKNMSNLAKRNGGRLKVKLHPLSYNVPDLFQDDNIDYYRNVDLKECIAKSKMVFFVHFSTVTPVILAYRPSIYFDMGLSSHTPMFEELKVTRFDMNHSTPSSIDLATLDFNIDRTRLIRMLYATDGKAAERIRTVLKG